MGFLDFFRKKTVDKADSGVFSEATGYAKEFIDSCTFAKVKEAPLALIDTGLSWDKYDTANYIKWLNMVDAAINRRFGDAKEANHELFGYCVDEKMRIHARRKKLVKWVTDLAGLNEFIKNSDRTKREYLSREIYEFCGFIAHDAIYDKEFSPDRKGSVFNYIKNCFANDSSFAMRFILSDQKTVAIISYLGTIGDFDYSMTDYSNELGAFYRNPELFKERISSDDDASLTAFLFLIHAFSFLCDHNVLWRNELVNRGAYLPVGFREAYNGDDYSETVYGFIKKKIEVAPDPDLLEIAETFFESYKKS